MVEWAEMGHKSGKNNKAPDSVVRGQVNWQMKLTEQVWNKWTRKYTHDRSPISYSPPHTGQKSLSSCISALILH